MDDPDHRPTPEYIPVQPAPRVRVRTPPNGVPVLLHSEPIQRVRARSHADHEDDDSQDSALTDPIEQKIERVVERLGRRKLRWLWRAVGGSIVAAGGAIIATIVKMLDAREAEGVDKQRLRYLEEELRYLRSRVDRSPVSRRDEQPDYAPWPAAHPSMSPTPAPQKDPAP